MTPAVQYHASTTVEGSQAGGLGHLLQNMHARVQCQKPKTGQEKVQLYCEDDSLFLSFYYLSIMYSYSTMCIVQCTVTMCSVQCTCTVQCSLYNVLVTMCSVQCTCTVYNVHCTMYSYSTMCNVHCTTALHGLNSQN